MHLASQAGHYECAILLSNAIKIADNDGKFALSGAICNGNSDLIDLLKQEVNAEALRYACITGS